jgi:hypothetical protein
VWSFKPFSGDVERMTRRWPLLLPPLAQLGALALWRLGWPPASRVGMYAQFVALFIMLVVYGAFAIARFRFLRRTYRDITRKRVDQAKAFQSFVDAHLPRDRSHDPV